MGKWKESIRRRMQTICNCFSAASKQAREAEVEVPSKRFFRISYETCDASSAHRQDAALGMNERKIRTGIGIRTFLNCLILANQQAEQSEIDVLARRSYKERHGLASSDTGRNDAALDAGERDECPLSLEVVSE